MIFKAQTRLTLYKIEMSLTIRAIWLILSRTREICLVVLYLAKLDNFHLIPHILKQMIINVCQQIAKPLIYLM